jgi:hypothetical protein
MTVKLATVLACLAAALAGCGGSGLSPAEAHFAAAAKAVCANVENMGDHADMLKLLARYRSAKTAALNSPRVAALMSDWAAERKVLAEMQRETAAGTVHPLKPGEARPSSLEEDILHLRRKVDALEKTLGFALCLGPHADAESVAPSP